MPPTLSVVIPAFNEAAHLRATVDALVAAVGRSTFTADVVLVDDGSTDGSAAVVEEALACRLPLQIVRQPNAGRFDARRAGVDEAVGEYVLLLDGRVRIRPDALNYVESRIAQGRRIWTAHVHVDAERNPYAQFWSLLAELAWHDYFGDPRDTSFGTDEFDRFPKGTTCFLAPRTLLADAIAAFRSRYADPRHVNDDTPLIRSLAERERINVSPGFACDYRPRTTFAAFLGHSFHRGVVFLDGHGRLESRFFPVVAAFYPVSALVAVAAIRRPHTALWAAVATALAAGTYGYTRGRSPAETRALALLAPVYAAAHGAGMWRGLGLSARRLREAAPRPPQPPRATAPSRPVAEEEESPRRNA